MIVVIKESLYTDCVSYYSVSSVEGNKFNFLSHPCKDAELVEG